VKFIPLLVLINYIKILDCITLLYMVQDVDALDTPTPDEIQETGREI
jgi:hypothetical protein